MSSKRRTGLSEGNSTILVDLVLKAGIAHRFLDYVYVATENLREMFFEIVQAAGRNRALA
jgi:hypothetical protein